MTRLVAVALSVLFLGAEILRDLSTVNCWMKIHLQLLQTAKLYFIFNSQKEKACSSIRWVLEDGVKIKIKQGDQRSKVLEKNTSGRQKDQTQKAMIPIKAKDGITWSMLLGPDGRSMVTFRCKPWLWDCFKELPPEDVRLWPRGLTRAQHFSYIIILLSTVQIKSSVDEGSDGCLLHALWVPVCYPLLLVSHPFMGVYVYEFYKHCSSAKSPSNSNTHQCTQWGQQKFSLYTHNNVRTGSCGWQDIILKSADTVLNCADTFRWWCSRKVHQ